MEPTDLQVLKSLRSDLAETIAGDDALAAAAEGDALGDAQHQTAESRVRKDSGAWRGNFALQRLKRNEI